MRNLCRKCRQRRLQRIRAYLIDKVPAGVTLLTAPVDSVSAADLISNDCLQRNYTARTTRKPTME